MTYQPTDEQIDELARHEASMTEGEWNDPMWSHLRDDGLRSAQRLAESPAFQAIIRAAQEGAVKRALVEIETNGPIF